MEETKRRILEYFKEVDKKVRAKDIKDSLGIDIDVKEILEDLARDGLILKCKRGWYSSLDDSCYICGVVSGNERGYAFLKPLDKSLEDMYISEYGLKGAIDGDVVLAMEVPGYGNKKECIVHRIIKEREAAIVGTTGKYGKRRFVEPDSKKIPYNILLTNCKKSGFKPGKKVIVKITKRNLNPEFGFIEGEITEVLGDKDEKGIDILSIAKTYGLEEGFSDDILKECDGIKDFVDDSMIKDRVDLRNLRMVTIDGEDAKDLDDAVSIEVLENGNYRLGVHIADVSYYVRQGSLLDKEALKRGTSVYLIDRVIPMLPKKLSNGICSLNPNVDRLSFSVMMEIDKNGGVVDHDIFESVINVNERMTYKDVYKILEQDDHELKERYKDVKDDFYKMRDLAIILANKMNRRGAIDFNFGEAKIELDDNGIPESISQYEITIANKIIEEFMIVCNETVSEHFYWLNVPFLYRIHEEPEKENVRNLAIFVGNLGYKLKVSKKVYPKALQEVLNDVSGKKEERIISTVMLRSMQKAKYSTQSKGHFGLAAKYYSHFTSPIRRYPDLMIHRIMKEVIRNEFTDKKRAYYEKHLSDVAKKCSDNEKIAQDAERTVCDIKKCEYMQKYVGCKCDGVISSITSFGFFVELPNTVEGLVRVSDLKDDYYIFDEKNYCLIGEMTGNIYRIGDEVRIRIARASKETKQIDFAIVGKSRKKKHKKESITDLDQELEELEKRRELRREEQRKRKEAKQNRKKKHKKDKENKKDKGKRKDKGYKKDKKDNRDKGKKKDKENKKSKDLGHV